MLVCLAPLRGITDHVFRTVYATHFSGFDCALAPFVSSVKGAIAKKSHIKDLLPENNKKLPIVPQIIGKNAEEFAILARQFSEMGHTTVNWNLGCPFPQVTRKKRGAGLLPFSELIESFLSHVISRISNKLSIKMRLGLTDASEVQMVLPVLNKFPLSEIIIHPRTASQMYSGPVDLESFSWCLESSVNPVVYNGEITSLEIFKTLSKRFERVQSWMIGRHAIADPFFAETLRGSAGKTNSSLERIRLFHDDLFENYEKIFSNAGNVLDRMKGIWFYLEHSLTNGDKILNCIQKTKRIDHYREFINKVFLEETLALYP
ncbi:MAG: tRNA-dihydrouridine synthase family protein [Chitinivibrionales bacterium]